MALALLLLLLLLPAAAAAAAARWAATSGEKTIKTEEEEEAGAEAEVTDAEVPSAPPLKEALASSASFEEGWSWVA